MLGLGEESAALDSMGIFSFGNSGYPLRMKETENKLWDG
jgi:hypothetical protein